MGRTVEDGGVSEQGAAPAESRPPGADLEVTDGSAGDGDRAPATDADREADHEAGASR